MKLKHILVIDDKVTNLKLVEHILSPYYKVSLLISEEQILKFISKNKPDLILLDMNMSSMNGNEIFDKIKENKNFENIPVIFLTDLSGAEVEEVDFRGCDFITKPFIPKIMLTRVKIHLEFNESKNALEQKISEGIEMIEDLHDMTMLSLAELMECRDETTGGHIKRTAEYVKILIEEIVKVGLYKDILTPQYVKEIVRSAPLHDIGKIGINDSTLLKAGALNDEEFEYMKNHVVLGEKTLQKMINYTNGQSFLYTAKDIAYYHHERWDGSGYPSGLKGDDILISARIMAIADVYDALTTKRPYKEPFTHEDSVKIIIKEKGKMFDPKIIDIFETIHYKFQGKHERISG